MKNKNNITEVVFILDASGSMYELTEDTIGGFNSMMDKQRETDGTVLVSTVTFNSESRVIHDRVSINEIPKMTEKDYEANGSTALIDAMGDAIRHISNVHKYIRKEDVPARTLFIITTDGMENCSRKYSSDEVKKMVTDKKKLGWEFVFLGANIDAVETAKEFGIHEDRAVTYRNDRAGTAVRYHAMENVITGFMTMNEIPSNWKSEIEEDMKNRK